MAKTTSKPSQSGRANGPNGRSTLPRTYLKSDLAGLKRAPSEPWDALHSQALDSLAADETNRQYRQVLSDTQTRQRQTAVVTQNKAYQQALYYTRHKSRVQPTLLQTQTIQAYKLMEENRILKECLQRKQRNELLFAIKKTGKGRTSKGPRKTPSKVRC
jgi:hypothetical protein